MLFLMQFGFADWRSKKKISRVHSGPWNHCTYLSVAIFGLVFFFWV